MFYRLYKRKESDRKIEAAKEVSESFSITSPWYMILMDSSRASRENIPWLFLSVEKSETFGGLSSGVRGRKTRIQRERKIRLKKVSHCKERENGESYVTSTCKPEERQSTSWSQLYLKTIV